MTMSYAKLVTLDDVDQAIKIIKERNITNDPILCRKVAEYGKVEIMDFLIKNGADLNMKDESGWSLLHYAARRNNGKALAVLLKAGANVNIKNNEGETPLHIASQGKRFSAVRVLLKHGADVDIVDNKGLTPIKRAEHPTTLALLSSDQEIIEIKDAVYE